MWCDIMACRDRYYLSTYIIFLFNFFVSKSQSFSFEELNESCCFRFVELAPCEWEGRSMLEIKSIIFFNSHTLSYAHSLENLSARKLNSRPVSNQFSCSLSNWKCKLVNRNKMVQLSKKLIFFKKILKI